MLKKGSRVYTPRFCTVVIKEVFDSEEEAKKEGYQEPTFYEDPDYGIRGRSIDINRMEFAAFKKGEKQ